MSKAEQARTISVFFASTRTFYGSGASTMSSLLMLPYSLEQGLNSEKACNTYSKRQSINSYLSNYLPVKYSASHLKSPLLWFLVFKNVFIYKMVSIHPIVLKLGEDLCVSLVDMPVQSEEP